jgi:hypothetical protein
VAFPDHHAYEPRDLEAVARRARAVGASLLVTTEKDAVRLGAPGTPATSGAPAAPRQAGETLLPMWALRVRLEPLARRGPQAEGGPPHAEGCSPDAWRAELRARVDAAAREVGAGTRP